jgi:hypothetical protein
VVDRVERLLTSTTARSAHYRHAFLVAARANLDERRRTVRTVPVAVYRRCGRGTVRSRRDTIACLYLHGLRRVHVVIGGESAQRSTRVRIPGRICIQAKKYS